MLILKLCTLYELKVRALSDCHFDGSMAKDDKPHVKILQESETTEYFTRR